MLKVGLAWHFTKYSNEADLAAFEATLKASKSGIWADPNPMTPGDNRKYHRSGISTKDSFSIADH
jgi:micrococcal nuclease